MRNNQDPVEFVLEENPELDLDDIHDVRTVAELLGGMVEDLEEKVYIMNKRGVPIEYVNPILGKSKIKYFMPLPEMPDDYKE